MSQRLKAKKANFLRRKLSVFDPFERMVNKSVLIFMVYHQELIINV